MHLASEKVRLAGEAAELAASFLVSAGSDYEAYEAEIEAKEGNRGGGARANPLQGVAFDGQAVALNPRTPNEVAIKEWAERVKCMRPGDHIAANTGGSPQEGNNGEEQWILAVYVDWNAEQDLFEVRDAEEDDPSVEQFKLRMRATYSSRRGIALRLLQSAQILQMRDPGAPYLLLQCVRRKPAPAPRAPPSTPTRAKRQLNFDHVAPD